MPVCLIRILLGCVALLAPATGTAAYAPGDSHVVIEANGSPIEVFVYKPGNFRADALIVSLHGLTRNAVSYRDHTRALAERFGALLIVPLFDRERFPTWRYQQGGIARRGGAPGALAVEPAERWTGETLRALIDAVRSEEGIADMPYALLGHSAGGQLLARVAAFGKLAPARIVIANPSSWVVPSATEPFPYGFGALPPDIGNERALQRYLAQPLTVLLGTADTQAANLSMTAGARRQGEHRYARGIQVYHAAASAARARGWEFNWTLVEVPGVGHSARRMYASPLAVKAFCPDQERPSVPVRVDTPALWPCADKP